jgi:pyruvate dehydrogenase E2 component (dihydrolipoamide acetyltransferase)
MSQEIILPDLGMEMDEALLITWTKEPGDTINQGDVIAEVETDKTTVEVESPVSGTLLEWKFEPGENLTIGGVIGYVGEAGEAPPSGGDSAPAPAPAAAEPSTPAPAPVAATNGSAPTTDTGRVKISPVARRIAEERGIDITQIGEGSGPGGRITKRDIENFVPKAAPAPAPAPAPKAAAPAPTGNIGYLAPNSYGKLPEGDDVGYEDVSRIRTRIAEQMVKSKQQMPHFYVTMDVNMDDLLGLRKALNAGIENKAEKISVNDMIVKAVALAARQIPNVNRHFYGDKYVVNKRVNVGIAVALDGGGLINVVAHDADRLSLRTMAMENKKKIGDVRAGKVKPADITGETITVSNLGMYGVDNFIAIVNPPSAAIVAVGGAKPTPIAMEDGSVGIATMMKVTLSADHRTVNGAEGGEFMAALREFIENPMRLL